ncbi:helix-turn-helix transcriptional regulator [Parabacteroides faecis]|uniref:helix-turn-helix domain-containing protein n=1 Tax=Parabacteroides faecis TaxID=1217282 RepID=UPI002164A4C9|nr:helix-turn-helix transcriptional regulator [Parabacteroides faecis]MCS2891783.1 helix-turn-helix transcriptional regulator [Parabacteroides faecis]UVQ44604.1 helix-turn-helix transcriptional regulator [Parabacteroides faecis]
MDATAVKKNNHGANARRWREWRDVKQDALADQIGVSQATLSGYEKKSKLEPEVIEKIAKALDIPEEAITELGESTSINIFSGTWQDNAYGNNGQNYNPTFNPLEKVVELYERLLKAEQEKVAMLQEIVEGKKERSDS